MTISEALAVLNECRWLKVSPNHVRACRYRSRAELYMLTPEQRTNPKALYKADVMVRRAKGETLEALLIRAAMLVQAEHVPAPSRPAPKSSDRCACGSQDHLRWNQQVKQRLCARCDAAWNTAARHNDMPPSIGEVS